MRKLKRKKKKTKWTPDAEDLVAAWIAAFGDFEQLSELAPDRAVSPEVAVIKNDLYAKLSAEAKEVIEVILNGPADFVSECIAPKTGKYKRKHDDNAFFIKKYFRKRWGSRLLVKHVFHELETYIKKII